jgi:phosphohistidine phosphatase
VAAPCELYLIRHGLAEERGDAWPDDSKRPLTEEGATRWRKASRALARTGLAVDVVLTSPLIRARQTAEIFAAAFSPHPAMVTVDVLAPDGALAAVMAEIEKHARRKRIAIVGHEPGLGELAARLAGMRQAMEFKKGAICRIDIESLPSKSPGALRWFLTPKLLRSLKK